MFSEPISKRDYDNIQTRVTWTVAVMLIGSLVLAGFQFGEPLMTNGIYNSVKVTQAFVLAAWALGPPIWFWFEFFFLYKRVPSADREDWDKFKFGQEVSSKVWIALTSALLILYFHKDIGGL